MNKRTWLLSATCLVGLIALGSVVARPPTRLPNHDYDIQYYSDAELTQRIGGERWTCSGQHMSWGETSGYRFYSQLPCD